MSVKKPIVIAIAASAALAASPLAAQQVSSSKWEGFYAGLATRWPELQVQRAN